MTRPIYSLVVFLLLPWALLHLLWRGRRQPGYLRHWGERFALYGASSAVPPEPTFWIHAVSVGETRAAQPLIEALRTRFPDHRILMTHMTPTGRDTSLSLFGASVESVYLPYDTPGAVQRFLRHFRPRLGLIMETELWPNLIAACKSKGLPLFLVNARLSQRSAARYARFPVLSRYALRGLAGICAQSAEDASRLARLAGPGALDVNVTGNVKFDITVPAPMLELGKALRQTAGHRPIWLAASTREGEEALIFDAWRQQQGHPALLVLVPRHPQRFDAVVQLARERGFRVQRRSAGLSVAAETEVLIGDSMGEMFAYYALADLAFVGGSLLDFGSQNLIEPCAVGTPVLIGPSTRNFAEAATGALACGAAQSVATATDLVGTVVSLLADRVQLAHMAVAGKAFAELHRGATQRTLACIERRGGLPAPHSAPGYAPAESVLP